MTLEQGALPEENKSTQGKPSEEAPKTEEQVIPPPELPEKYQGKTVVEIAKMLEDREATITRQGEEVGALRNENAFYRNQPRQQAQPQPEPQPVEEENFDWDKPNVAVDRIVEKRIKQYEDKRQEQDNQRRSYEAKEAFLDGQKTAREQRPELFKGIEQDVDVLIEGWYAQSRGNVTAGQLRNPTTWYHAARMIHDQKSNFKPSTTGVTNPTTVPATETPSSVKPQVPETAAPVEMSLVSRELAKGFGMTNDEMKEAIRKEQDERARRAK